MARRPGGRVPEAAGRFRVLRHGPLRCSHCKERAGGLHVFAGAEPHVRPWLSTCLPAAVPLTRAMVRAPSGGKPLHFGNARAQVGAVASLVRGLYAPL